MPRAAGQIDLHKNEAILDAAATVLSERGMAAPIERIAKVAGVSKQTIYNHYGSKHELVRALIARRSAAMTEGLEAASSEEELVRRMAEFAERLLRPTMVPRGVSVIRILIASGDDLSDLSRQIYAVGPDLALEKLSRFLEAAHRASLITVPDPFDAAEYFIGMVLGQRQVRTLLGMPQRQGPEKIGFIAREAALRFVRAYAP